MLSVAEIPSTGFTVEILESKFLWFLDQSILDLFIWDIVKLLNFLLPATGDAERKKDRKLSEVLLSFTRLRVAKVN